MNSRERFTTTCHHQAPDRAPIDYLAHPETDRRLKDFYGVEQETELLDVLGCDFYYLSCRDISQNESCLPYYHGPALALTEKERVCPFGIRFRREVGPSKFAVDEAVAGPLEDAASEQDILQHAWPEASWFDFAPLVEECEANAGRVIIGGFWAGILGDSYRLHGFQNFLLNMALRPELIKTLVNRVTDFYLEMNDHLFSLLKGKLDVWFFGNDFGSQQGLLFSPAHFADFFLPGIKRLVELAHGYGLKVMMHSCGSVVEIIPLLLEAGVDILDPVQTTAAGMEPEGLKRRFGARLVFHGGVDTQQILPGGSVEEVTAHCRALLATLGRHGGYIVAPSQILQPDVPLENIDVLYRTARGAGQPGSITNP